MILGVTKEIATGETRVALVPETVRRLRDQGWEVIIEKGAGLSAFFSDAEYVKAGATAADNGTEVARVADLLLGVQAPAEAVLRALRPGSTVIALLDPLRAHDLLELLARAEVNAIAMELIPRITRAQSMDVLSSQATVAGYRAVLLAAVNAPRLFPMLMTAAGTIAPARVLVLGAGVAGLQAIATARRLGAVVQAFDIRPAVKEQVESLGAQWVGVQVTGAETAAGYAKETSAQEQRKLQEHVGRLVGDADVVIATAQVPGKPAPTLVTAATVESMRAGSVIVDLAAESGGNCELTVAGQERVAHHVRILGPVNLAAGVPAHASQMYSRNLATLLAYLKTEQGLRLDLADEILGVCCVTYGGQVRVMGGRVPMPDSVAPVGV
ncbi:MAG: Re/Si-specific NAD(P)(+) transhydrogenase subunit alpha [Longimicrobiales bacterium]